MDSRMAVPDSGTAFLRLWGYSCSLFFFLNHMMQAVDVCGIEDEADNAGDQDEGVAFNGTKDCGRYGADTLADGDQHTLTLAGLTGVQHIQICNAHGDVL